MRSPEAREVGAARVHVELTAPLHVGVLGPLEVRVGERTVGVTTGRLRALLAVMAMSAGRIVPVDWLATAVWGEDLPDDARRSVQLYITRLRRALGSGAIRTEPDGYVLNADEVDALRFLRLLDAAANAPDRRRERTILQEALALWRGTPFEGIRAVWLEQVEVPKLVDRYMSAVERRIDLDLATGVGAGIVGQLRELTASSAWHRALPSESCTSGSSPVTPRCARRRPARPPRRRSRGSCRPRSAGSPAGRTASICSTGWCGAATGPRRSR